MSNITTVAARIREDRMPWSTIHGEKMEEAAKTVESKNRSAIIKMFKSEIDVHEMCGNYIKAGHLKTVLADVLDDC